MTRQLLILALAGAVASCSAERDDSADVSRSDPRPAPAPGNAAAPDPASAEPVDGDPAPARDARRLTLAGLGPIVIGEPPPSAGPASLVEDAVQISVDCRTWRSPRLPGVFVMTDGKVVTRITLMRDSPVATERGIRLGAREAEIRRAYPKLEETPHEYAEAPAKNLVWRPAGSASGLRFEIDGSGRANLIHAGLPPWLDYSEGCA